MKAVKNSCHREITNFIVYWWHIQVFNIRFSKSHEFWVWNCFHIEQRLLVIWSAWYPGETTESSLWHRKHLVSNLLRLKGYKSKLALVNFYLTFCWLTPVVSINFLNKTKCRTEQSNRTIAICQNSCSYALCKLHCITSRLVRLPHLERSNNITSNEFQISLVEQ